MDKPEGGAGDGQGGDKPEDLNQDTAGGQPEGGEGAPAGGEGDPAGGEGGEGDPQGGEGDPAAKATGDSELRQMVESQGKLIAELKEQISAKAVAQPEKEDKPAEAPKPLTDEEWIKVQSDWGISVGKAEDGVTDTLKVDGRKLVQTISQRIAYGVQKAMEYADKQVHGNVSDMRFETIVGEMSQKDGFRDIRSHAAQIKEYLSKRYDRKDWGNPQFIEDGLYWARGKAGKPAGGAPPPKRTIIQPAAGGKGGKPAGGGAALTADERKMIGAGRQFANEAEYLKYKNMDMSKI